MEFVNVSKMQCPTCWRMFTDGSDVAILGCGGGHVVCGACHTRVRSVSDSCPLCRRDVGIVTMAEGRVFTYEGTGASSSDPIVINHPDEVGAGEDPSNAINVDD